MNALEIKIAADKQMLAAALTAVENYANLFFAEKKEVNQIILAMEEALNNVLAYSNNSHLEIIEISANGEDGEFTVCVLDKGLPGNFEETLQGEERLGLTIMRNAVDVVSVENLGRDGRCQKLIKYYVPRADFSGEKESEEIKIVEDAVISVRAPKKSEVLNICRAIYEEYGLTYGNDLIYYPERFYAASAKDEIHSTIAVDQYGGMAGHHAVFQWDLVPGIWEGGMAVVSKNYRNCGVFGKMMERSNDYIQNIVKTRMFMGEAVCTHPYTQKLRLKVGSRPCGFMLAATPEGLNNSSFQTNAATTFAYAASVYDFTEKTVYCAEELKDVVSKIYGLLELPRNIVFEGKEPEIDTGVIKTSYEVNSRNGKINCVKIGRDYEKTLKSMILKMKNEGIEMITLFLSAEDPAAIKLYEAAKVEGFFFTGLLPNADQGDVFAMQKMISRVVDYDSIVVIDSFAELLNEIRKFDPDQQ